MTGLDGRGLERRRLYVLLPASYDREPERRYPVLYVHDGESAFAGGLEIHRGLDALAAEADVELPIVVAIGGAPHRNAQMKPPLVRRYGSYVVERIKPWVDASFRTRCGRSSTLTVGYSLGAVPAFYLPLWYPETFGRAAAMSPSFWVGGRQPERDLARYRGVLPERLWLDIGALETGRGDQGITNGVVNARRVRDVALRLGMTLGDDLRYEELAGVDHGFGYGGRRILPVLRFLLAAGRRTG